MISAPATGNDTRLMMDQSCLQGMRSDFQALDRVHAAHKAATAAFPPAAGIKEMSPEAAQAAIDAEGEAADHAVALARSPQGRGPEVVAVAPRLPVGLAARGGWGGTTLELPEGRWRDAFSGAVHAGGPGGVALGELLGAFPVALLTRAGGDEAG